MIICHLKNGDTLDFNEKCNYVSLEYEGKVAKFKASAGVDEKWTAIVPVENILWVERR